MAWLFSCVTPALLKWPMGTFYSSFISLKFFDYVDLVPDIQFQSYFFYF
jgi:hypothetical protein